MSTRISLICGSAILTVGLSLSVARAAPPEAPLLKRETPDIESAIVINYDPSGFETCQPFYTATAGTALLVRTVTGAFSLPPGGAGSVRMQVTLLGGKTTLLDVPMQRTAGAPQEAGTYDQYSGSLALGGIPVVALQACVAGIHSVSSLEAIGFVVTTP